MIRSPHAFAISLLLHMLIGMIVLFLAVPEIVSLQKGSESRYRLSLSHVLPAFPVTDHAAKPAPKTTHHSEPQKAREKPAAKQETAKEGRTKTAVRPEHRSEAPPAVPRRPEAAAPATRAVTEVPADTDKPKGSAQAETEPIKAGLPSKTDEAAPVSSAESSAALQQTGESYLNEHLAVIAELLRKNLFYPELARRRHIEGEVLAAFTLHPDGTIAQITIKKHAHAILDRAAVRTIQSLSGMVPHPQTTLTIEVPIRFVLR